MKKLLLSLFILICGRAFGAAAAYDLILSQRPDSGTGPNAERLVTPTANYVVAFDGSKHPTAIADTTWLKISQLGTGVQTFLGTPSWTNFLATVTGATPFASTTKADVLEAATFAADAGSTDAYAITLSPAITSYVTGAHYRFKANTANTGAATIDINSLGAKTIKKVAGGVTTDLADNDIRAGQWVDLVYDGTNMQMQSLLGNAAAGGGTPGGSNTQVQYNNSSAFGGVSGVTSDGTNMTAGSGNLRATSPRFTTDISDSNGNEVFKITATGSAVNELTVANAATGSSPTITASGGDSNVGMNFNLKGTGNFVVNGAASNDNSLVMNAASGRSPAVVWQQNGTGQMYSSMAISVGGGIAGSAIGDWLFVQQQSKSILMSIDNGATQNFALTTNALVWKTTTSQDCNVFLNASTNTKNTILNFQLGGSGKADLGIVGATNERVPGTAQFDMYQRSTGSMWFSSDAGSTAAARFVATTGQFLLLKNITSTSTTTGTLVVTGGLGVSENVNVGGDIATQTIGKTLKVKSGSNALAGTFTLSSGAATVSTTAVDANSVVCMSLKTASGTISQAPYLTAITAGTSFVVAAAATDNSTYNWVIIKVN